MKAVNFLLFLHFIEWHVSQAVSEEAGHGTDSNDTLRNWGNSGNIATNLLFNAGKSAAVKLVKSSSISPNCSFGLGKYISGLRQMKYWAFSMLDSSGILPTRVTGGKMASLGDFDTCINIAAPDFNGKYCMLLIKIPLKSQIYRHLDKEILETTNDLKGDSHTIRKFTQKRKSVSEWIGYCVPSICTKQDIEEISKKTVEIAEFEMQASVRYCVENNEEAPYTIGEIITILVLVVLLSLVVIGTMVDIFLQMKSLPHDIKYRGTPLKFALCFSAYSNINKLLEHNVDPSSISIFNGLRVIAMLWIMLSHVYILTDWRVHDTLINFLKIAKELRSQPIINGNLGVETFFFISSLLMSYRFMKMKGEINILQQLYRRYYRLGIPLILVIGFACAANHLGSGPFWKEIITDGLSKNCKENGWFLMLYIHNYFPPRKCMDWTWYLSADTQLYAVGLLMISLLKQDSRKGITAIGFFFLFGIFSSVLSHIYYNLPPTMLQTTLSDRDASYYYSSKGYVPTHFHLASYCVGIFTGYILAGKKIHLPKHINRIGWAITVLVASYLVYGTYFWNQRKEPPGLFISTLYGSTYRFIWALCLAFLTVSCTTGNGGIVNSFLSWNAFVPLSKLSFMIYLIHLVILKMYIGAIRTTITYDHRSMIFQFCGLVVITSFAATLLVLMIELPLNTLRNVCKMKKTKENNA